MFRGERPSFSFSFFLSASLFLPLTLQLSPAAMQDHSLRHPVPPLSLMSPLIVFGKTSWFDYPQFLQENKTFHFSANIKLSCVTAFPLKVFFFFLLSWFFPQFLCLSYLPNFLPFFHAWFIALFVSLFLFTSILFRISLSISLSPSLIFYLWLSSFVTYELLCVGMLPVRWSCCWTPRADSRPSSPTISDRNTYLFKQYTNPTFFSDVKRGM